MEEQVTVRGAFDENAATGESMIGEGKILERTLPDGRHVEWVNGVWAGETQSDGSREAAVTVLIDGEQFTQIVTITAMDMAGIQFQALCEDGEHRRSSLTKEDG